MYIDFLLKVFKDNSDDIALVFKEKEYSYKWVLERFEYYKKEIQLNGIQSGDIVSIRSEYKPESIALMLALIDNGNCLVPISLEVINIDEYYEIGEVEFVIDLVEEELIIKRRNVTPKHDLLLKLKEIKSPGLIIFSSGSTGKSKASVHDFLPILEKFKVKRIAQKTISFYLFDHIGGINTILYILSNAGTIIPIENRNPDNVCKLVEKYKVEHLPLSPTFLSMILISKSYEKYDISSLKTISYGTEVMPESTLKTFNKLFPNIQLRQAYGLSELGILRSKSKSSDSIWLKVGGEGYETKIKDDILFIKAKSAMLGYLNAPSPFDEEGWFNTQDKVETDGDWIRILGRETDIINVGGQKVYPAEVESVLCEIDNIESCTVYGVENALLGFVVGADILLSHPEELKELKKKIRQHCRSKLESYKIPVHINIVDSVSVSSRFKKIR